MSASGESGFGATVGGRIAEARRALGVTQAELAASIGVSLGTLDRFETGRADPSSKLAWIAEVTGKPVAWLEGGTQERSEVAVRIASALEGPLVDSSGAEPSPPPSSGPPASAPELKGAARPTARSQPAGTGEQLARIADSYEQLAEELRAARANRDELAGQLDTARSELAVAKGREEALARRVSELETAAQLAEERAESTAHQLAQSNADLERMHEQERSVAEILVWARQAAIDVADTAKQDAERIVHDAERRAGEMVADAEHEVELLASEREHLRTLAAEMKGDLSEFLLGALERLEPVDDAEVSSPDTA